MRWKESRQYRWLEKRSARSYVWSYPSDNSKTHKYLVIKKVHRKIELDRYLPARIGKKTPTKDATRRTLWREGRVVRQMPLFPRSMRGDK
jgi:hypothetical protein